MKLYEFLLKDESIFTSIRTEEPERELEHLRLIVPVICYREVVAVEPTFEEIKIQWRDRANADFSARKELYLKNIAYADAVGRDSVALKISLLKEEMIFKERILKINQGINPYEAAE